MHNMESSPDWRRQEVITDTRTSVTLPHTLTWISVCMDDTGRRHWPLMPPPPPPPACTTCAADPRSSSCHCTGARSPWERRHAGGSERDRLSESLFSMAAKVSWRLSNTPGSPPPAAVSVRCPVPGGVRPSGRPAGGAVTCRLAC